MRFVNTSKIFFALSTCAALAACKSAEERADDYFKSGLELVEAGDPNRAMVEFRNALELSDTNIDARRQIALIKLNKGNRRGAYRDLLRIVEQQPSDVDGRIMLSELAFLARNWDEFDRHAPEAARLAPDSPDVQVINLAAEYRNALIAESGISRGVILTQAQSLAEEQPDSEILTQILIDGYASQQQYEKAIEQVEKLIAADPDNMELYSSKLELLARMGDNTKLEIELQNMAQKFPDNANVKSTYLRFLISRNKLDEAEGFLRDSLANATPEEQPGVYTSLIQFLLQAKGRDAVFEEIDTALSQDPNQDNLRALRATINFDSGNRDVGISELQELLAKETSSLSNVELQNVKVALAKMLVSSGNEVGARKLVEGILDTDPNAVGALKMQAAWMVRGDDTDGAISSLRTALDQAPQDAEAMTLMAEAYNRAGDKDLMLNFLSQAVEASNNAPAQTLVYARALAQDEKLLQAERALIASLRITPGNVEILSALGQTYLGLEDMPRAQQVRDTLRNIEGNDAAQASANALEVEILAREAGSEQALEFLEDLAKQDGTQSDAAKLAILRSQLQTGALEDALNSAQKLVEEEPDNVQFQNALAMTFAAKRDFVQAEEQYKDLLTKNPGLVQTWLQLSRVKIAQGARDEAIGIVDEGLELNPGAPDLLWAKASFVQNNGDIDGAIEIYEGLYETFSNSPVIANNLASLLSTYRSDPNSIARAQVIARRLKDTDIAAFQDTYGWLQHLAGDSEVALGYLEPAAKGLPQDVSVQVHLGLVYAALNKREEALEQLRSAIALAGPLGTAPLVEQARSKIDELEQN